jgi:hypothetical protein
MDFSLAQVAVAAVALDQRPANIMTEVRRAEGRGAVNCQSGRARN